MNILRNILAVLLGYATFVISAVLLFQLSGIDPHERPSTDFVILTVSYGLVFSFIGGFLAQLISKSVKLFVNLILAGVIATFALFSLIKTGGNHYTQFAAIFLFAPMSILGGVFYLKNKKVANSK